MCQRLQDQVVHQGQCEISRIELSRGSGVYKYTVYLHCALALANYVTDIRTDPDIRISFTIC
jgi:hypothetical protein